VLMRDQNLAAAREAIGHEPGGDARRRSALAGDCVTVLSALGCLRGRLCH